MAEDAKMAVLIFQTYFDVPILFFCKMTQSKNVSQGKVFV
jgi:hypothetical protein